MRRVESNIESIHASAQNISSSGDIGDVRIVAGDDPF